MYTDSRVWNLRHFLVKVFENKYHFEKIYFILYYLLISYNGPNVSYTYIMIFPAFQEARNYFKQNPSQLAQILHRGIQLQKKCV